MPPHFAVAAVKKLDVSSKSLHLLPLQGQRSHRLNSLKNLCNIILTINNGTSYITVTPLNFSLFVPSVIEYPSLSGPDNGYLNYTEGNNILNSSCQHTCYLGFLTINTLPCGVTGVWNGTRIPCESNVMRGVTKKSPRDV